jgi:hypothetical protein
MVTPNGVPEHDVGLCDRAVSGRPLGEPVAARTLVWKVAGGEALAVVVRGDPSGRLGFELTLAGRLVIILRN